MMHGKFITIDGQHGSGKTTMTNMLYREMESRGYSVVKTMEPTDSEIGILARNGENIYSQEVLVCLFAADRIRHSEVIRQWLSEGKYVICDRYIISGIILQNMGAIDFEYIKQVNRGIVIPDISIILHADPNIIKQRLSGRKNSRFAEQEQREGFDRYLKFKDRLTDVSKDIYYFENNTDEDMRRVVDFIMDTIGQR